MVAWEADEADGFQKVVGDAVQTVVELGVVVVMVVVVAAAAAAAVVVAVAVVAAERPLVAAEENSVDQGKGQLHLSEGAVRARDTGTDSRLVEKPLGWVDKDSLDGREECRAECILEDGWHQVLDNPHLEVTLCTRAHQPWVHV